MLARLIILVLLTSCASGFVVKIDSDEAFSAAKYTMQQVDPSGKLKDRFTFKGYESGDMMYLRREDLKKSNQDLRDFILKTITTNKSAKY